MKPVYSDLLWDKVGKINSNKGELLGLNHMCLYRVVVSGYRWSLIDFTVVERLVLILDGA